MDLDFTKAQALGNDFIIINDKTILSLTSKECLKLSNRKYGIGCDQIIIITKILNNDIYLKIYNADGSIAEACGNGFRAVARYIFSNYQITEINIFTGNKTFKAWQEEEYIAINIPAPSFKHEDIGLAPQYDPYNCSLQLKKINVSGYCVSVGNPHFIIFSASPPSIEDIKSIGHQIENHSAFYNKINVGFATIQDNNKIILHTWERGSGYTLACGTNASASFIWASRLNKIAPQENCTIVNPGGEIIFKYNKDSTINMYGSAKIVFFGTIKL